MAHTPGPWAFHAPLPTQGIKHFIVHEKFGDIAEVYLWDATEASEANARLIAAAPDLLEACQKLIEAIEGEYLDKYAVSPIRDAITLATGSAS